MATQKYTALGKGTLASGYTVGDTSITLVTGGGATFPSSGDFVIAIDSPPAFFLKCTARAGEVITVAASALEGTTEVNKGSGIAVTEVITPYVLDQIRADAVQKGTYASAAQEKAGNLYLPTDSVSIMRDNGSGFDHWGPIYPCTKVSQAVFTWVNQGAAQAIDTSSGIYMEAPGASGVNLRMLVKATPATPWSVIAGFTSPFLTINFVRFGICIRDSGTGKVLTFSFLQGNIASDRFDSATAFNSNQISNAAWGGNIFFKVRDDGTNIVFSLSRDGVNFSQYYSTGRTAFLTTPNQFGIIAGTENTVMANGGNIFHWKEGV